MKFPEHYRQRMTGTYWESNPGDDFGRFVMKVHGRTIAMIATAGGDDMPGTGDWEHVSVSLIDRCPTWEEMCRVKALFWEPDQCVVQFHPPEADYVNQHPFCLHLWRWRKGEFPSPPSICVGVNAPKTPISR